MINVYTKTLQTRLRPILNQISNLDSYSDILSVLLGGSYAENNQKETSDIDLLIICKNNQYKRVFRELFSQMEYLAKRNNLDVKLIEEKHIATINNSTSAPFFYSFTRNSICLVGEDYRTKFTLTNNWAYQTVLDSLECLNLIKKILHNYHRIDIAKILLYEQSKILTSIFLELTKKCSETVNSAQGIFDTNEIRFIKKITRKQMKWISLFEHDKKNNKLGFISISLNKRNKKVTEKEVNEFEKALTKFKSLANECLDLL